MLSLLTVLTVAAQTHVEFVTPSIVRVQWTADGSLRDNATGVCTWQPQTVEVSVEESPEYRVYTSAALVVEVSKHTGAVLFRDRQTGRVLLQENARQPHQAEPVVEERIVYDEASARVEDTANGKVTVKDIVRRDTIGTSTRYRVDFCFADDQALYGLGSHMEDYMNLLGKTLWLTQHNLKATIPVISSTNGYGLLFDAGSAMKFETHRATSGYEGTMQIEAARELDYYFIKGETMDDVVKGYRWLTGRVSMMPRYIFGYTQSKERYVSSDDILQTLSEYRRRQVPVDMIVQDWNYWPQGWGYMKMNPKYYPDPKALADSVHALHARLMVSIWPNPQGCPEETDFRQRGFMLEHSIYDVFNPEARKLYWKYAYDEFFSRGFDAWWCDSSEPLDGDWNRMPEPIGGKPYGWDDQERRWQLNKDILSDALGVERSSLYSLYHSMGIYENQRAVTKDKRVVNLTRSTYAGQQRYGTLVWNGDTHASWASFRQQIPSGLNYMATGNPYWTVDVGAFFTRNDGRRWFYTGEFPEGVNGEAYREFYTRMFQWATFLPVLRSHGSDTPREIWRFGEPGTPYYDAILRMIRLRYSLVPYIYSMAAAQTRQDYTMARMLAFDFADDPQVLDLKDEYMFGRFLVCPVVQPLSETAVRRVYLPAGETWMDFWTGQRHQGGQWLSVPVSIAQLPLYVRAGSIITTTEVAQYTDAQVGLPLTVNVYPGRDAHFELYEDEGDNYNFEQGAFSVIPLDWDEARQTLTVGAREGSYPGMPSVRKLIVKTPTGQKTITYKGRPQRVRFH